MVRRVGFNDARAADRARPAELGRDAGVSRDSAGRARGLRFRPPIPRTLQPGQLSPVALVIVGFLGLWLVGWAVGIVVALAALFGEASGPGGAGAVLLVGLGLAVAAWVFATRVLLRLLRGLMAVRRQTAGSRRDPR